MNDLRMPPPSLFGLNLSKKPIAGEVAREFVMFSIIEEAGVGVCGGRVGWSAIISDEEDFFMRNPSLLEGSISQYSLRTFSLIGPIPSSASSPDHIRFKDSISTSASSLIVMVGLGLGDIGGESNLSIAIDEGGLVEKELDDE